MFLTVILVPVKGVVHVVLWSWVPRRSVIWSRPPPIRWPLKAFAPWILFKFPPLGHSPLVIFMMVKFIGLRNSRIGSSHRARCGAFRILSGRHSIPALQRWCVFITIFVFLIILVVLCVRVPSLLDKLLHHPSFWFGFSACSTRSKNKSNFLQKFWWWKYIICSELISHTTQWLISHACLGQNLLVWHPPHLHCSWHGEYVFINVWKSVQSCWLRC